MADPYKVLLLPGPGRAARHLRIARWKLWATAMVWLLITGACVAGGYQLAQLLFAEQSAWAL